MPNSTNGSPPESANAPTGGLGAVGPAQIATTLSTLEELLISLRATDCTGVPANTPADRPHAPNGDNHCPVCAAYRHTGDLITALRVLQAPAPTHAGVVLPPAR